ncbi:hypothetical protein [Streptomyces sp. NWU339]|uniref:hypothetical protein n=1 Tax=Streptomyces sp. NWU339 TaxID=2185284 RepID=UPI0015E7ECCF|nr:hypothetical protein [Streptomyces sp. NWU339]
MTPSEPLPDASVAWTVKTRAGEEEGVATVPGGQLQHFLGHVGPESRGGVNRGIGRLLAVHARVGGVRVLPVPPLGLGQPVLGCHGLSLPGVSV